MHTALYKPTASPLPSGSLPGHWTLHLHSEDCTHNWALSFAVFQRKPGPFRAAARKCTALHCKLHCTELHRTELHWTENFTELNCTELNCTGQKNAVGIKLPKKENCRGQKTELENKLQWIKKCTEMKPHMGDTESNDVCP